jgi:DNA-binding IclR family transcriptional regulator
MSKSAPVVAGKRTRRGRPPSRNPDEIGNSTPLVGLKLLQVIAHSNEAETLTQIARRANLSISRAFRYLKGMTQAGFLHHNEETGKYTLGAAAIELGLAAISKLDAVDAATGVMRALTKETALAVTLSIWGHRGATVLRTEHPDFQITLQIREGTILSLPITAVGRVFLAYLPAAEVEEVLKHDLAMWNASAPKDRRITRKAVEKICHDVRLHGLASATGLRSTGVAALAAPVFGPYGRLKMCLALVGISSNFDTRPEGAPAVALKASAQRLSEMLGGSSPHQHSGPVLPPLRD